MTFKEIQQLIKLVNEYELMEFKMKEAEFELSIRTKRYDRTKSSVSFPTPAMIPVQHAAPSQGGQQGIQDQVSVETPGKQVEPAESEEKEGGLVEVRSPIVGTFYRSPAPDKPPYIKVGDIIEVGSVVCIVEAMKLFNEIESEVAGKIVKVVVEDASPVEYDQVLFLVDPNG
jgi:acetyl-CoA carboxylase biotin carboxyl carrier protein